VEHGSGQPHRHRRAQAGQVTNNPEQAGQMSGLSFLDIFSHF
jgi:hypothetical protein